MKILSQQTQQTAQKRKTHTAKKQKHSAQKQTAEADKNTQQKHAEARCVHIAEARTEAKRIYKQKQTAKHRSRSALCIAEAKAD